MAQHRSKKLIPCISVIQDDRSIIYCLCTILKPFTFELTLEVAQVISYKSD